MKNKETILKDAKEYNIYAGLGGGFGGASYQYTGLFNSQQLAEEEAYQLASDDYESYSGSKELLSYEEALENAMADNPGSSEEELQEIISKALEEDKQSWIEYYAILTSEDNLSEDEIVRNYIISDGDSIRETSSTGE